MFLWSPPHLNRRFQSYHGICSRIANSKDITVDGQMVCYDQGAERKVLGCDFYVHLNFQCFIFSWPFTMDNYIKKQPINGKQPN